MRYPILFALMTALFFGLYGPSLAQARSALHSPFKPYFAIGLAYLVWATLGGIIAMRLNGDSFTFTGQGMTWGFIAGSMGAFGALALTLAMFTGGGAMPHIVMPIVFGGATTVTALVALRTADHVNPWLGVGIVLVAVGIVLVAYNTPHAAPPAPAAAETPAEPTP